MSSSTTEPRASARWATSRLTIAAPSPPSTAVTTASPVPKLERDVQAVDIDTMLGEKCFGGLAGAAAEFPGDQPACRELLDGVSRSGKRRSRCGDHDELVDRDLLVVDSASLDLGAGQADTRFALGDALDDLGGVRDEQRQVDPGMLGKEPSGQPGDEVHARRRAGGDHEMAGDLPVESRDLLPHGLQLAEDAQGNRQEDLPSLGQIDSAVPPLQQRGPEFGLERLYLHRDSGLGDLEHPRSSRERAGVDNRDEGPELLDVQETPCG